MWMRSLTYITLLTYNKLQRIQFLNTDEKREYREQGAPPTTKVNLGLQFCNQENKITFPECVKIHAAVLQYPKFSGEDSRSSLRGRGEREGREEVELVNERNT